MRKKIRAGELERVRRNLLNSKLPNGIQSIRPEIVPLDLADLNQLPNKAHHILRLCLHVDILINNGGISLRSDVIRVTQEVDLQLMNVNYFGAIALTKGFIKFLHLVIDTQTQKRILKITQLLYH